MKKKIMITEDYVSFETAKLLKDKGFNENTPVNYFVGDDKPRGCVVGEMIYHNRIEEDTHLIACPTLQMAMKWLRKEYNIFIQVELYSKFDDYCFELFQNTHRLMVEHREVYNSYEETCEAAIKYCLENLISKNKNDECEDKADGPFAIVTNVKTGKWFRVKKCLKTGTTFSLTPKNINDAIPVIGTPRLGDCLSKKECIGDNEKLHIEFFNADKVNQDQYFLFNVQIISIDSETNEILLSCDYDY